MRVMANFQRRPKEPLQAGLMGARPSGYVPIGQRHLVPDHESHALCGEFTGNMRIAADDWESVPVELRCARCSPVIAGTAE